MSDEPEEDEDKGDEEERPFLLSDGDCMVFDPEYLDPEMEPVGVLAAQFSMDRGLWALHGFHDAAGRYQQEWREVAPERGKAGPRRLQ